MKRLVQLVSVLFVSVFIGCVSAKQRAQEQQELERSIRTTSDPDAVKDCSFIVDLRPDGLHSTPEAQAASLVIPKEGVSWVVFGGPGRYQLYSCSHQKTLPTEQQAKASAPTSVETKPEAAASAPVEAKAPRPTPEAKPEVLTREQTPRTTEATEKPEKDATKSVSKTRVTNNPEAVKGCKFLESFSEYQKVLQFQESVVRAGGNLGYVVATNQNGDVIGESYLCSEAPKP
jgi:outer membrane biosynthesis protein TonB